MDNGRIRWNGWGTGHAETLREPAWDRLARRMGMPALLATPPRDFADIAVPPSRLSPQHQAGLAALLGPAQVRIGDEERARHARGRSYADLLALRAGDLSRAPDAVLLPRGEDDVLAVLAYCSRHRIAVVPYGGGTGVVGGVNPARGDFAAAVTLDMTLMDRVVALDTMSGLATVEAGIRGPALERQLAAHGLTLGHVPQSFEFSTLGGWIAHHGSGQDSGRYGRAGDWLESLRVATPKGILACGHVPASAAGPDLSRLMLGSEGVFGVITSATVRLRARPGFESRPAWLFRDFAGGIAAAREAVRAGIPHAMLRLSDAEETHWMRGFETGPARAVADFYLRARGMDGNAALLVAGLAGSEKEIAAARRQLGALARRLGAVALGEGPGRRWQKARFEGPCLRDALLDRGVGVETLETAASWSKLPALYAGTRAALDQAMRHEAPRPGAQGLVMAHVSHLHPEGAGLYFTLLFPRRLDGEMAQAAAIRRAGMDAILAHGGTLSHHHGVGEDHLAWMAAEKGPLGMGVLAAVKASLDPEGILNPGKLIAPARSP